MFKFDDEFTEDDLSEMTEGLDANYLLSPNDVLLLDVFTNKGERLIDPNFEMGTHPISQQQQNIKDRFQYVIQADGMVVFPLIGRVELMGISLTEAELKLTEKFDTFYEDSFVKLRVNNRRVFLLGALGGKVIPLPNENTGLIEVLASAGGLDLGAKSQNLKLIRKEKVFLIDLSTISSALLNANITVEPGDIIYVEPWRSSWLEALRTASPVLGLVSGLVSGALTLVLLIQNL